MGKNTSTTKDWFDNCYPESVLSNGIVNNRFAYFKHGRTDADDPERFEKQIKVVAAENIKKINRIVLGNRIVK